MKLARCLAVLIISMLSSASPSRAAVFAFAFAPDTSVGADIGVSGFVLTDDAPVMSSVVDVSGQVVAGSAVSFAITGIAPGNNLLDPQALAGYFSFASSFGGVGYTFSFGPSAFASYGLTVDGDDGSEYAAAGDLRFAPAAMSPVPLPPSATLFGAGLMLFGTVGACVRRAGCGSRARQPDFESL